MSNHIKYRNRGEVRQQFRHSMQRVSAPPLEVGRVYRVKHETMGEFSAVVLHEDVGHVLLEIVEGYARRRGGGVYEIGEQFPVLRSRAEFTPGDGDKRDGGVR